jgi:RHS repeat-associated protein
VVAQRYAYNGKELVEGIGLYDYGFRYYDPVIGRFTGVDPIADKFPHLSTYNYASNNPISNFDLWGLQGVDFNTSEVDGMTNYFSQNARERNRGRGDDCLTCHIKGLDILTGTDVPSGNNSGIGNTIEKQRNAMQEAGLAEKTQSVGFEKADGSTALPAGQAESMETSLGVAVTESAAGTDNSVFGISMADGYHTMTLTVTNEQIAGPVPGGEGGLTISTFTLSDQGTNTGTFRQGNTVFTSTRDLDQHLTDYIRNSAPGNFPARIDFHQIINPRR